MEKVKSEGDRALLELTKRFDGVELDELRVPKEAFKKAYDQDPKRNSRKPGICCRADQVFAENQLKCLKPLENRGNVAGVSLGHRLIPIENCGAYIPAGLYPFPSNCANEYYSCQSCWC